MFNVNWNFFKVKQKLAIIDNNTMYMSDNQKAMLQLA